MFIIKWEAGRQGPMSFRQIARSPTSDRPWTNPTILCVTVNMNCKVDAVRVTPCAEAEENKPCVIKRGKTATIEFDYEPSGNYSDLETRAYWASVTGDLPFIGMDTNGCAHTECPTTPPKETFSYNLSLSKKLPVVSSGPPGRGGGGGR
ncbi:hypothetical protein RUM44_004615 [Polyplax serrata]|uniref:MD-2-related lipid-recognition domain-containing protein n=1 Tax=Polyplax serrata TaxID=468196 RepID=A0ABR1B527_POLSC